MNFQEIAPTNENSLLLTEAMQIKINASMKKTYPSAEEVVGGLEWWISYFQHFTILKNIPIQLINIF